MKINLRDGINHVQSHLDSVPGVVTTRLGQARHAVVTVTEDLYTQTFVVLGNVNNQLTLSHFNYRYNYDSFIFMYYVLSSSPPFFYYILADV